MSWRLRVVHSTGFAYKESGDLVVQRGPSDAAERPQAERHRQSRGNGARLACVPVHRLLGIGGDGIRSARPHNELEVSGLSVVETGRVSARSRRRGTTCTPNTSWTATTRCSPTPRMYPEPEPGGGGQASGQRQDAGGKRSRRSASTCTARWSTFPEPPACTPPPSTPGTNAKASARTTHTSLC